MEEIYAKNVVFASAFRAEGIEDFLAEDFLVRLLLPAGNIAILHHSLTNHQRKDEP